MSSEAEPMRWSTLREAVGVVIHPPHLRKTLLVTVVVGTLLFVINQLDVVIVGEATPSVWIKAATTYLVPFGVSNYGLLLATRCRQKGGARSRSR